MKRIVSLVLVLLLCISLLPTAAMALGEAGKSKDDYVSLDSLAREHGFIMGASYNYMQCTGNPAYMALTKTHFSSLTCTNETKAYSLLNQQASKTAEDGMPVMNYFQADKMVQWAQDNGMKVRGHVLVWDAYMCDWFFREGYDSSKPYADQETIRARTKYYIEQVITHFEEKFPGVIYCWDVVNEAIGDNAKEWDSKDTRHLRTIRSGVDNLFKTHVGDDYVEFAFLCAKDTVEKLGADIKLFYNDYNMFFTEKRDAAIALARSINTYAKDENGNYRKLIDGMGMQGYIGGYGTQQDCLNDNHIIRIETSINLYAKEGLEVHITEMAVRNFQNDEATVALHADFYGRLFEMFKRVNSGENKPLTCVAIWGVTDNPYATGYNYNLLSPYGGLVTENYAIKTSFDTVHGVMSK
ncbi:MAG: endo-1,4-beta-xylanase [Clostridia bacterium]|nr:endo-1,4-beta-xylanase [Clostridia bacterium]